MRNPHMKERSASRNNKLNSTMPAAKGSTELPAIIVFSWSLSPIPVPRKSKRNLVPLTENSRKPSLPTGQIAETNFPLIVLMARRPVNSGRALSAIAQSKYKLAPSIQSPPLPSAPRCSPNKKSRPDRAFAPPKRDFTCYSPIFSEAASAEWAAISGRVNLPTAQTARQISMLSPGRSGAQRMPAASHAAAKAWRSCRMPGNVS